MYFIISALYVFLLDNTFEVNTQVKNKVAV